MGRGNGGGINRNGGGFKPRGGGFGQTSADKAKGKPYGKLNCTSLEEVNNDDNVVIGTLKILSHPGKVCLILELQHLLFHNNLWKHMGLGVNR